MSLFALGRSWMASLSYLGVSFADVAKWIFGTKGKSKDRFSHSITCPLGNNRFILGGMIFLKAYK